MSHQAPRPFFMPPAFYYQQAAPGSAPPPPPPPFYFYNAPAAPAPPPPPPTFCYAPVAPAPPPPPPALGAVPVRQVWARNLDAEMDALLAFATRASHVAINVQYPGVIVQADAADQKDPAFVTTEKWYALLKSNVDVLKPLQIGLAVLRDDGQIMSWEFNLRGFDPATDPHSARSVAYLASRGMDLDAHRARGVPVARLGMLLHHSALLRRPGLRWVMHAGEYHVAFLLKVITGGQPMPGDVHGLRALAMRFLCGGVKDVKHMAARHPGLPVGLERIAGALGLAPPPGRPCLAGARAVLAMQVFILLGSSSLYPRFAPYSRVQM